MIYNITLKNERMSDSYVINVVNKIYSLNLMLYIVYICMYNICNITLYKCKCKFCYFD